MNRKPDCEFVAVLPRVETAFVTETTQWKYSSARNFAEDHTVLGIDDIGFLG